MKNGPARPGASPESTHATARPSADLAARAKSEPAEVPTLARATPTTSSTSDASSLRSRTLSSSATFSPPKSSSSWIKTTPTVNVHTTCGRHTDQYFFGGPSLAELARSLMKK